MTSIQNHPIWAEMEARQRRRLETPIMLKFQPIDRADLYPRDPQIRDALDDLSNGAITLQQFIYRMKLLEHEDG